MNDEKRLAYFLSLAVPIWIEKLKTKPYGFIKERQKYCSQIIASNGDNILYKSKKKGESSHAFNCLAEGVAILALLAKGGVEIFGCKFDYQCPQDWLNEK